MKLTCHVINLRLRHTFTIAHGSADSIDTFLVELEEDGFHGFGESQAVDYYKVGAAGMRAEVEAARDRIEAFDWDEPAQLFEELAPHLSNFALCAVDQAAHDLWGKKLGKPVYELFGLDPTHTVPTDYTIGIDTIEKMVAKMQEFPHWPIYKIKLGTDEDLAIVRALRRHTDAIFRIDANTAWTAAQTIENSRALRDLGVEFLEQPLPAGDWDGMKFVMARSALPVIADESCIVESDVDRCSGFFHGVNIKLTKCGGITPARRMIRRAKELELKAMIGCMTESSIGIAAIAQLLPMLDYVDMDGALLIENDVATGVSIDRGMVSYPNENGTGVRFHG